MEVFRSNKTAVSRRTMCDQWSLRKKKKKAGLLSLQCATALTPSTCASDVEALGFQPKQHQLFPSYSPGWLHGTVFITSLWQNLFCSFLSAAASDFSSHEASTEQTKLGHGQGDKSPQPPLVLPNLASDRCSTAGA